MFLLTDGYFLIEDTPRQHYITTLGGGGALQINDEGLATLKGVLYKEELPKFDKQQDSFVEYLLREGYISESSAIGPDKRYLEIVRSLQSKCGIDPPTESEPYRTFLDVFCTRKHICLPYLQLFLMPISTWNRAQYICEQKVTSLALMGDDDLLSFAVALSDRSITTKVFEVDSLLIAFLDKISSVLDLNIETCEHDLMKPLPEEYRLGCSAFATEPDDWGEGFSLFVGRGWESTDSKGWGIVGLSDIRNAGELLEDFGCTAQLIPSCVTHYFRPFGQGTRGPSVCPRPGLTIRLDRPEKNEYFNKDYTGKRFYSVSVFNQNRPKTIPNKPMNAEVLHSVLKLESCAADLQDEALLDELAARVVAHLGLEVMGYHWYRYNPIRLTGIYILKQSSMTIHSWPEYSKVIFDITTCGVKNGLQELGNMLKDCLRAGELYSSEEVL